MLTHVGLVWDENNGHTIPNILATAQENCTGGIHSFIKTYKKSSKTQYTNK
jgi:hypothetical protein